MTFDCFDWFFFVRSEMEEKPIAQCWSVPWAFWEWEADARPGDEECCGSSWCWTHGDFSGKLQGNPKISWLIIICPRKKQHNQPRIHKVRPFTGGLPIVILKKKLTLVPPPPPRPPKVSQPLEGSCSSRGFSTFATPGRSQLGEVWKKVALN